MKGVTIRTGNQVRFKLRGNLLVEVTVNEDTTILPGKMFLEDGIPYFICTVIQDLNGNVDALCEEHNHFSVTYSSAGPILVVNNHVDEE